MTDPADRDVRPLVPPLGQLALQRQLVTQAQLDAALGEQARAREAGQRVRPLGEILVAHGVLNPAQLAPLLRESTQGAAAAANAVGTGPEAAGAPGSVAFGKYTLLREIGRGGKGIVHEALDTVLNRKVAIKTIHAETVADPREIEAEGRRFLAEARISASLPKHPHIVSVYEAGEIDGKRYLAMELIPGQAMTQWRRIGSVTLGQQVALIRDVALALDESHRAGVVHRDIKPQNILVDREHRPHLTDFGLAKIEGQEEDLALTLPGKVWGTPAYMSPEHARGLSTVDHRADVYSLGVLLYEALAGRTPFRSDKPSELLDKVVHEAPPPLARFVEASALSPLQRALEPVCLRALSKDPAARQSTAKEFADAITRCLQPGPAISRKLLLAGVAAAASILLIALGVYVLSRSPEADDLGLGQQYLGQGRFQDAAAAFDRELVRHPDSTPAAEGKRMAQRRLSDQYDADKRRAAEEARREERARFDAKEQEIKERLEARRKAQEEEALVQQAQLLTERREAEERARRAEEARQKAEDKLARPPTPAKEGAAPAPSSAPAPATALPPPPPPVTAPAVQPGTRGADSAGTPAAAPTGEPRRLEDGSLHFEAEDFSGGAAPVQNVDYRDLTPGNSGHAYRQSDVDISPLPEGGFFVSDIMAGEWLHYSFQGSGRYRTDFRYWNRQAGSLHLEIDGLNVTGPVAIPVGSEGRGLGTAVAFVPALAQGRHDVRVVFDTRLDGLDWFRLIPLTPAPIPEAAALRDAEKLIRDAFKGDYLKKSPADLQALARKLQAESSKPQKDPAVRYSLLAECRDAASQGGDITLAMATIDEIDRTFAVDAGAQKIDALAAAAKATKSPEVARSIVDAYAPLIDHAVDRDDYESALLWLPRAESAARMAQSPGLVTRMGARLKEVGALRDEYRALKPQMKALETSPDDAPANLAVGLFRCFAKGDWLHGAPLLARGSDAGLALLAQKEAAPPGETQAQIALADGWREAGEKRLGTPKVRFLSRALYWYEKALPDVPGLLRMKIEGHVEALTKAVYGGSDVLRKGLVFWVEPGKEPQDPYREHIYGSRVQNNGSTIVDQGVRAIQFNLGPKRDTWIEYPAVDAVRAMDKGGSLFAWIKADTLDYWGGIVNRGGVGENVDDFGLWIGRGYVGAWFNYPENRKRLSSKGLIPAGRWTLVGVSWDDRTAIFYIDGKEEGINALTAAEVPPRRNTKIAIGSNPPGGHDFFLGLIGAVMIYNRPLTPPEAGLLFMSTRPRFK